MGGGCFKSHVFNIGSSKLRLSVYSKAVNNLKPEVEYVNLAPSTSHNLKTAPRLFNTCENILIEDELYSQQVNSS